MPTLMEYGVETHPTLTEAFLIGAPGALLDAVSTTRVLPLEGFDRVAVLADTVAAIASDQPAAEIAIGSLAGYPKFTGDGVVPTSYAETEAATYETRIQAELGSRGVPLGAVRYIRPSDESAFDSNLVSGTTIEEVALIAKRLTSLREGEDYHQYSGMLGLACGPLQARRVQRALEVINFPLDRVVLLPTSGEHESALKERISRGIARVVLHGQSNLSPDGLIAVEQNHFLMRAISRRRGAGAAALSGATQPN